MKNIFAVEGFLRVRFHLFTLLSILFFYACEPIDDNLGINVLPPGDSIFTFSDTLYDLDMQIITPSPIVTSVAANIATDNRVFLLGSKTDTITGVSQADILTQLTITQAGIFGDDPLVDSLQFSMYVADMEGDTSRSFRVSIYEFTGTLDYDSIYYSDYSVEGKYDPVPLAEGTFKPTPGTAHTLNIKNADFLERVRAAARDTVFEYDSLAKKNFPGLYITSQQFTDGGAFAKIQLYNNSSRLGFRYLHDSISADTASYEDYGRYYMNFDKRFTQSLNIFAHDKTGSGVEPYLDHPETTPTIAYIQGMAGVNVKIHLPDALMDLVSAGPVSINRARLFLPVVPDSISGIAVDEYPPQLMLANIREDQTTQVVYDYLINPENPSFGKLSRVFDVSAFVDPVYYYSFDIGMYIQSVINGDIPENDRDLLLFIKNPFETARTMKLWSNHSGPEKGPKLEVIYSRF